MSSIATNVSIKQLLVVLSQMNLRVDFCDVECNEKDNTIRIIMVQGDQEDKGLNIPDGDSNIRTDLSRDDLESLV